MHQENPLHLALECERAIRFVSEKMPISDSSSRKPILFHNVRVGVALYQKGYPEPVVVAGILHDTLEFAGVSEEKLRNTFGDEIARLVRANTKDDSIVDKEEKTHELISRCVATGEHALIIKTADILDSFEWYTRLNNAGELDYCRRNATAILRHKPDSFQDPLFKEFLPWIGEKST